MKKPIFIFSLILSSLSVYGYTQTDVDSATYLASKGIITQQSTTAGYRLDAPITRAESLSIALKIKWIAIPKNYTCKKYFIDVVKNDWICAVIERAADNGMISRENVKFRPQDAVTRAESLSIIMRASGISRLSDERESISRTFDAWAQQWQKNLFATISGVTPDFEVPGMTFITTDVHDYMYFEWKPNQPAIRSYVMRLATQLIDAENEIQRFECYWKNKQNNFISLSEPYYRIDDCIYIQTSWLHKEPRMELVLEADGETFKILDNLYARDKNSVFRVYQWWIIALDVEGQFSTEMDPDGQLMIVQNNTKSVVDFSSQFTSQY